MKKKDLEKIFPNITDEQIQEINKLELEAYEKGKKETELSCNQAELERNIKNSVISAGAKNEKAVIALLDIKSITLENGEIKGLKEQLETLKKEAEYLFDIPAQKPQFTKQTKGISETAKKDFESMGYRKRLKMFSENPELYKSLIGR